MTVSESPSNIYPVRGLLLGTVIYMGQSPYLGIWAIWLEFHQVAKHPPRRMQPGLVHRQCAGSGLFTDPGAFPVHQLWIISISGHSVVLRLEARTWHTLGQPLAPERLLQPAFAFAVG